jgi:hypothetical protein
MVDCGIYLIYLWWERDWNALLSNFVWGIIWFIFWLEWDCNALL